MGFLQDVPNADGRCLFLYAILRIAGDQDDRSTSILTTQVDREVDAADGRHLVVDHEAIYVAEDPAQKGSAGPERPHVKTIRLEQELQRSKHSIVIVDDVHNRCSWRR